MKKLTIILISIFLNSCSYGIEDSGIYEIKREYLFKVVKIDSNGNTLYADTLIMRIERSGFLGIFNQKKAYWYSTAEDKNEFWRGFTDDGKSLEIQVPIHIDELSDLTIAPYPKIMIPPKAGYKISSSHSFIKGYGEQTGKTIEQEIEIGQQEKCRVLGQDRGCWRINGQNTSLIKEEGLYKMTALFEMSNGFVEWKYLYPNRTTVIFKLIV